MSGDSDHSASQEEEELSVEMSDLIALQLSTVVSLTISPTFSIGVLSSDRSKILVPMMSCVLKGTFGRNDDETPMTGLVTLDNLAFLAARLGDEFVKATNILEGVSRGGILPDRERLDYAADLLESGAKSLTEAGEQIRMIAARTTGSQKAGDTGEKNTAAREAKRSNPKLAASSKGAEKPTTKESSTKVRSAPRAKQKP